MSIQAIINADQAIVGSAELAKQRQSVLVCNLYKKLKREGTVLGCHEFMIWGHGYTDTMYIKVEFVAVRGRALLYSPRKNVIVKRRWEKMVDTGFKF